MVVEQVLYGGVRVLDARRQILARQQSINGTVLPCNPLKSAAAPRCSRVSPSCQASLEVFNPGQLGYLNCCDLFECKYSLKFVQFDVPNLC